LFTPIDEMEGVTQAMAERKVLKDRIAELQPHVKKLIDDAQRAFASL
jgi:hypothetical protein